MKSGRVVQIIRDLGLILKCIQMSHNIYYVKLNKYLLIQDVDDIFQVSFNKSPAFLML